MAMLTTVFTFVLLTFGAIFVDAENYVTQEQLRELLTANRVLSERLDKLQSTVAHCKESNARASRHAQTPLVAFTAALSRHLTGLGVGQNVRFDHVIVNVGNGYAPSQGTFTAPVAGMYVFSTTLLSHNNHDSHFQLTHNGNVMYYMYVGGGGSHNWDTSASSAALNLQQGDIVAIQNVDVNEEVNGDKYSLFSGYLLKASEDTEIVGKK